MSNKQRYVDDYRNMYESRISVGAMEKLPVSEKSGANHSLKIFVFLHGPMSWKVMQRSVWKDITN